MSLAEALNDWKQLATTQLELNTLRKQAAEIQSVHDNARMHLEEGLEELEEDERQAILAIMSVYEQRSREEFLNAGSPEVSSHKSSALQWLINKVGNEGSEGIAWAEVVEAWQANSVESPTSVIYGLLNQHNNLFTKKGLGKWAVVRLTAEGQSMFLGGK